MVGQTRTNAWPTATDRVADGIRAKPCLLDAFHRRR
jgi:hypothetical protein